tara:strand:- start:671 stop:2005 length:1335 start_codon:yes stop_codon:yes gene_type:complete
MAHARLGPSNHRWPYCPGSVREEAGYEDVAGAAAIDGTGSHELLELCLVNGVRAESYLGHIIAPNHHDNPMGWMVSDDRIMRVQQCLDYVSRRHGELMLQYTGAVITIEAESRSNPGSFYGREDWWGTVDITFTVRVDEVVKFIEICDYKDGRGWVNAKDNTQLLSYLGGKAKENDMSQIDGFRTSIVQPKTNPPIRYHDYLPNAAMGIVDGLAVAANKTDDPDAPLVAGKHCQWCKANQKRGGHCTVESQQSIKVVQSMSNNLIMTDGSSLQEMFNNGVGDVSKIDSIKLSEFASAKAGIMAVFDKFEDEIRRRVEAGEAVTGYAMKPGRSTKKWNEDAEAIEKMLKGRRLTKDDIYPRTLISPAQALKHSKLTDAQRVAIEKKYITSVAGKLSLTQVAHGEESTVEEMFKDVVAQCDTPVVQSPVSLFDDEIKVIDEEVSFF